MGKRFYLRKYDSTFKGDVYVCGGAELGKRKRTRWYDAS
jgi:hypothetical protein